MKNKEPTIGSYIITRNNEDSLNKLLKIIKDFSDEIHIVDTGSTDDTIRIAKKYTSNITYYKYPEDWKHPHIDDFAKARNMAMKGLTTDWVCWFDSDDYPTLGSLLEFRKHIINCPESFDAIATVYQVKRSPNSKSFFVSFPKTRVWRKDSGYHWIGRVHEEITGDQEKCFLLPLTISTSATNDKSRGRRNLNIFEDMIIKEEEFRIHDYFYCAREYRNHGVYDQAFKHVEEYIKRVKELVDDTRNQRNYAIAHIFKAHCFVAFGNTKLAKLACFQSINIEDRLPLAFIFLGELYIKDDNYAQALPWFMHAYNLPPLDIRYTDHHAEKTFIPLGWMAICYLMLGNQANAQIMYEKALECEPSDDWLEKYEALFKLVEQEDELE